MQPALDVIDVDAETGQAPAGRRERKKIELKNALLKAALELFASNGLEQTTLDDICDACDIARRTFYNYFPTKQALVYELCDRFLVKPTGRTIDHSLDQAMNTLQRLEYYFNYIAGQAQHYGNVERELLVQLLAQLPAGQDKGRNLLVLMQQQFSRIFNAGVQAGDLPRGYDADFLAEMTVAALNNTMCNWVHDAAYPVAQRLRAIPAFVLRAARPA